MQDDLELAFQLRVGNAQLTGADSCAKSSVVCLSPPYSQACFMQDDASARALQLRVENAQLSRAEGSLRVKCSQLQESVITLEAAMRQLEADSIAQQALVEQQKYQVSTLHDHC